MLGAQQHTDRVRMERALIRLGRWRQQLLINTYRKLHGNTVYGGPFAGMTYSQATEGATLPRLLGCYEAELHPLLGELNEARHDLVIDIGCAEGYYAVGLAKLLPACTVMGYDLAESARAACGALAKANGVEARVQVERGFEPDTLSAFAGRRTLVFCDIEGAEADLLDPARHPYWSRVDLIVEVHECFRKGLVNLISQRFAPTHDIQWISQSPSVRRDLPPWVFGLSHLDQILCTWEWRAGPTPWAVMKSRELHCS